MITQFLTTAGKGVAIYLNGQATLSELYSFFIVLLYAYWPLYFVAVDSAIHLALQHTVWLVHNLILNLV